MVRTGYDYSISSRTSDMFAYTAKQDGVVKSVTDKGIIIEYKDSTQHGVQLGRVFGKAEGSIYPHDIVTHLEAGKKFKKGDNIAYNTGWFEQDILDPTKIVLKKNMVVKTALLESDQTFEDSSSISIELSGKISAKTTKVKSLTVGFKQNILNPVKVGQSVTPKDLLLIIEDEITSNTDSFDEESLSVLRNLSNQAPKAKYHGIIDKIEVFYNGDKEDMSSGLRALADQSDRVLAQTCKATNKPVVTGRVDDEYRVSGTPLSLDKAEIKIYLTINTPSSVGDKGVFANQMKSVIGEVMNYSVTTKNGEKIDAIFSYRGFLNRIVNSPILIGTTTSLLKKIADKAIKIYEG